MLFRSPDTITRLSGREKTCLYDHTALVLPSHTRTHTGIHKHSQSQKAPLFIIIVPIILNSELNVIGVLVLSRESTESKGGQDKRSTGILAVPPWTPPSILGGGVGEHIYTGKRLSRIQAYTQKTMDLLSKIH